MELNIGELECKYRCYAEHVESLRGARDFKARLVTQVPALNYFVLF